MARSVYRNNGSVGVRTPAARTSHAEQAPSHRKGKGHALHLPGNFWTGACIYQIDEWLENAPGEKTAAYMPPVAQKRALPNKMHYTAKSGKHVAL